MITLGIVGVVSILVLSVVFADVQEQRYDAARLKALASIGEAARQIATLDGLGCANDSKDFVENYLKKHLTIIKSCENNELRNCGIETQTGKFLTLQENKTMPLQFRSFNYGHATMVDPYARSYGFVMSNGYAVNLFYNPKCISNPGNVSHNGADLICVNAIYDMNGVSGPNQVGKDIGFVTVLYPDERSVAVAPNLKKVVTSVSFRTAGNACKTENKDWSVANIDELTALAFNNPYILRHNARYFYSSTSSFGSIGYNKNIGLAWALEFNSMSRFLQGQTDGGYAAYCIKRNVIK